MRRHISRIGFLVTLVWIAGVTGLTAQTTSAQATAVESASAEASAVQQTPLTPAVLTPVPRVIWFSGAFTPADKRPVGSVETVTVAIYREREGGDVVWQETQTVRMEADGRYSLLMGSTLSDGLPLDVFTSGEPRWIGITVNRPGEAEQPRVHLASVPYALKAADTDTLGGKPASAYLLAGQKTPRGSKSATDMEPPLTAGTPGYLGQFVDPANLGNSALYQSGTSIGLGTTAPIGGFHVAFTNGDGGATGYAVQNLSAAANAYSGMLFYDQNGALGQFQGFNNSTHEYRINNIATGGSINFMIGSSSKLQVANNGNVQFAGNIATNGEIAGLHLRTQASQNGPSFLSANLIAGSTENTVAAGVTGVVIAGGGATNGFPQQIFANYSAIGGGYSNTITVAGAQSTIAGGVGNVANNGNVAIGGGQSNTGSGFAATVPGGTGNTASGSSSFAAGNRAKAMHNGSFVWGDSTGADVASTANDQMTLRANGGVVLTVNATNAMPVPVGTHYRDNTVVAWGRVSGNLLADGFNVASVTRNNFGNYTVVLNTAFSGTALVPVVTVSYSGGQPISAAAIRIASTQQILSNTTFNVFINNGTFAAADADFTFIVTGR